METWDIHIKQRMSGVDPIQHILQQPLKETYTFKDPQFLITDDIKAQIENYVYGHFVAGLKEGPASHRWRLVGKIFLHWPTFQDQDFQNPIVVIHDIKSFKVMTGITRLWAKSLMSNLATTKALIFHKDKYFYSNRIESIKDASEMFLTPIESMLISVDYYNSSQCYFINEFDFTTRDHMKLFLGHDTMQEFEKYWAMLHNMSNDLGVEKYSKDHIIEGVKQLLSRI